MAPLFLDAVLMITSALDLLAVFWRELIWRLTLPLPPALFWSRERLSLPEKYKVRMVLLIV